MPKCTCFCTCHEKVFAPYFLALLSLNGFTMATLKLLNVQNKRIPKYLIWILEGLQTYYTCMQSCLIFTCLCCCAFGLLADKCRCYRWSTGFLLCLFSRLWFKGEAKMTIDIWYGCHCFCKLLLFLKRQVHRKVPYTFCITDYSCYHPFIVQYN